MKKITLKTILTVIPLLLFLFTTQSFGSATCDPKLLKRAINGDVNAQSYVAHLYTSGKGVTQDYAKARYWYGKVANHKSADAKIIAHANLLLGLMYNAGKGGTRDYSSALRCFKTAAAQGYYDAHISIGNMYAQGLGVKKDYSQALFWWKLAAKKGHPQAPRLVYLLEKELDGSKVSG